MKLVAWFALGFIGMAGMGLVLSSVDVAVWPVAVMTLLVGALIVRVKSAEPMAMPLSIAYLCGFGVAYLRSFPIGSVSSRMLEALTLASMALVVVAVIAPLFAFFGSAAIDRRRIAMLIAALAMGVLVGYVSGDAGGAGSMRGWLRGWFSPAVAEAVLWTARKSIHVAFYGVMAFLFYRAAKGHPRAALLAAVFALSHGVFDEARQSVATSRLGTPIDLIFDGTGILIGLAIAKRKQA